MIEESDLVVLTHDLKEYDLKHGDVGTVVHKYEDGEGCEIEFATADGETIVGLTLTRADIRPRAEKEILRVREF
jgi:hypothetical protein